MKSTHLRNLLIAVFCLLGFGQSQAANYYQTVELREGKFFKTVPARFNLTVVASALGTDAATLADAFNSWQSATEETPWEGDNLLFLNDPENGEVEEYTCDGNGFYMNRAGGLDHWGKTEGNAGIWYVFAEADAENDLLQFNIGASNEVPEGVAALAAGDQVTCNLILKFNGQEKGFDLTLKIVAAPEVPTPTTIVESELNVVGTKQITVEQYPRSSYDADKVTLVIEDLAEKLGTDAETIADNMEAIIYGTEYNDAETVAEGQGLKKEELTNNYTANPPGFWLREVMNEDGEYTGECSAAGWSDTDKFFVESFAYDTETYELTCNLGQYQDALKKDEAYYVNIYLLYGDKAYQVRYNLKIKERPAGTGMDNYVKKGENSTTVEQVINSDYSATAIAPDLDEIASALECEVADLRMKALDSSGNFAGSTANNGGFWFDTEGIVTSWGSGAFFIEPTSTAGDYTSLNVGQHASNVLKVGDQASANLYFMASEEPGSYYYEYKVTLKVIEPKLVEDGFEAVATRTINKQVVPDPEVYLVDGTIEIDIDEVESLIGTRTPVLYGYAKDDAIIDATNGEYSKAYSCTSDPAGSPGFWLDVDGRVSIWGDANARVGINFLSTNSWQFFQFPGRNAVGDVFKTTLFLVNEDNSDMIAYNITLKFVEEIGPGDDAEIVGEVSNVLIPLDTEVSVPFNLNLAAEALGVTIDDLMDMNCLRGGTNGEFGTLVALTDGISYNSETFEYDPAGDIYLVFDQNGDEVEVTVMGFEVAEDFSKNIEFCIEVEGKRFIYHAKLVSLQAYATGIESISNGQMGNGTLYDLSGRQVAKAQKGIYIQNGKRFVVK